MATTIDSFDDELSFVSSGGVHTLPRVYLTGSLFDYRDLKVEYGACNVSVNGSFNFVALPSNLSNPLGYFTLTYYSSEYINVASFGDTLEIISNNAQFPLSIKCGTSSGTKTIANYNLKSIQDIKSLTISGYRIETNNPIAFDSVRIIPEPSICAMLALCFVLSLKRSK